MGAMGSTRFLMVPKVKWLHDECRWEEPMTIRLAVSEILNYQEWRFVGSGGDRQKAATPFQITKITVRKVRTDTPEEGDDKRNFKDGILIAALDIRDLDVYLAPLSLPNTYRPY